MARQQVVICDKCGARKKEANHWYTVFHFEGYEATAIVPLDMCAVFGEHAIQTSVIRQSLDACGIECAVQLQSMALSSGQPINGSTERREATA
jgi:hypothetical protein